MEEEDEWRASGIIGNKVGKMRAPHPVFGRDNIDMDWDYTWISFRLTNIEELRALTSITPFKYFSHMSSHLQHLRQAFVQILLVHGDSP